MVAGEQLPEGPILVAGARGMVGQALRRALRSAGREDLLCPGREEVDWTRQAETEDYLRAHRPGAVLLAAARVGGIHANATYPADFLRDNLAIGSHLIEASFRTGVPRLLNLGSTCIYPREAPQPLREDSLLTGPLEPTNEAYALAKIATLKMAAAYRSQYGVLYHSAMPTNLYGPGDNYHPENSHVLPGLLRRMDEARERGDREVVVWGSGRPLREFLHVDELAGALLHLLALPDPPDWVNVGTDEEVSIRELAERVREVVGFRGEIRFDPSRPDGTPRKKTDLTRLRSTGWQPTLSLAEGLRQTYDAYRRERAGEVLRA